MKNIKFDETPKDYSKAFLKQNPFPSTALPEENPRITADRKNAIEKFVHIINNVRHKGESTVAVFIGDYGSGKSHILRVFNTNVLEKLFISEKNVINVKYS